MSPMPMLDAGDDGDVLDARVPMRHDLVVRRELEPEHDRHGLRGGLFPPDGRRRQGHARSAERPSRHLIDPLVAAHNGQIVKTTGDGLLL